MTKTKIIAATFATIVLVTRIGWEGTLISLAERHPTIDKKIIRKLHFEMAKDALLGKYDDIDLSDVNECDKIFLAKVQKLTA